MNVIRIWISNSPQLSTAFQDICVGVLNQSRLARFLKLRMDACPHLWKRSVVHLTYNSPSDRTHFGMDLDKYHAV